MLCPGSKTHCAVTVRMDREACRDVYRAMHMGMVQHLQQAAERLL